MRIVIDTNIIFAALKSKHGASNYLLHKLFQEESLINIVSIPLMIEYEDVLTRPENLQKYPQIAKQDIISFIDDICAISNHQKIFFLWRPFLSDPKDDMVLETAFNGKADYIITHNIRDFRNVWEAFAIRPIVPSEFLKLMKESI